MKKAELQVYKQQLLALRARLRGDVNKMADAALRKSRSEANGDLSSMPIHMADIGTDNFEQEFTLSLMENDGGTLNQIESSLERIEEGSYGQCEECGVKIPKSRLNAIPYATLCVRCAEQQEQDSWTLALGPVVTRSFLGWQRRSARPICYQRPGCFPIWECPGDRLGG